MSGKSYVGVNNIAREIKKAYIGVNNVAREVKKAYVGVNGIAREIYSGDEPWGTRTYIPGDITSSNGFTVSGRYSSSTYKIGSSSSDSGKIWCSDADYTDYNEWIKATKNISNENIVLYKNWKIEGICSFVSQQNKSSSFGSYAGFYETLDIGGIMLTAHFLKETGGDPPYVSISIKDINGNMYYPASKSITNKTYYDDNTSSNFSIESIDGVVTAYWNTSGGTASGTVTIPNKIVIDQITTRVECTNKGWYGYHRTTISGFPPAESWQQSGYKKVNSIIY